jgi:hypothetical protein
MPFAAADRANTNPNRCGAQWGTTQAASLRHPAVALYLTVLTRQIHVFLVRSFITRIRIFIPIVLRVVVVAVVANARSVHPFCHQGCAHIGERARGQGRRGAASGLG